MRFLIKDLMDAIREYMVNDSIQDDLTYVLIDLDRFYCKGIKEIDFNYSLEHTRTSFYIQWSLVHVNGEFYADQSTADIDSFIYWYAINNAPSK